MPLLAPLADLHPDHKAQTACHDQEHDHSLYIIITDIGSQRGILPEPAKQIEARIAERRDGRECTNPDALCTELRHKGDHQKHHTTDLKGHRQLDHDLQHIGGLRVSAGRNAFSQQPQILKAHPAFGRQRKKLVRVTKPRPPTWISSKTTACPKGVNCVQVSRTTRPVTQVALVAVNMASTTPSRPLRLEMGSVSSSVPKRDQQHKADADDLRCTAAQQPAAPARCSLFRFIPISWLLFVPGRLCCTCTSFCTHAAHEHLSYRIHLFSFRFNLILWGSCGIIIWYPSS